MGNSNVDDKSIGRLLTRGVSEVILQDHLKERLESGESLRVKLGIDPTAQDLHLGHTVVLRKLRQFQDLGHKAILIIGDFTATIGDPSGRNDLRPMLTKDDIKKNMEKYLSQAGKVLNMDDIEVLYNSKWFENKGPQFVFELASKFTVARSLERDDFQKRMDADQDISMLEVLYPIFQGYDSVEVKADVELGGTDQKFNLLTGRKVQRKFALPQQDIVTMDLMEGTDGVKKMSKSIGNYIAIDASAQEMYGKLMAIPDKLMPKYFELLTDVAKNDIDKLRSDLVGDTHSRSPKEWKEYLASTIVTMYFDSRVAQEAQNEFTRVFSSRELPEHMPEYEVGKGLSIEDILYGSGVETSKTAIRRLVQQKGVKIDDEVASDSKQMVISGKVIKIGSRRFLKTK